MAAASGTKTAAGKIRVTCDGCGKTFGVPASKAGKRGPCPKCGQTIRVPGGTVAPKPAPAPAPPADGEFDWNALAGDEANARVVETAPAVPDDGGYDFADDEPAPKKEAKPASAGLSEQLKSLTPEQRAALRRRAEGNATAVRGPKVIDGDDQLWGFPSFLMGLTLSVAGALLGGAIWFALLAAFGIELKLLAILIGALAGGGMFAGYQKHDLAAGALAAFLAAGGIVLAKVAILTWGVGFLIDHAAAEVAAESEKWVEEEYEQSALELVSLEDAKYGATQFEIERYRRDNGIGDAEWYRSLDWIRARHEKGPREKIAASSEAEVRDLYSRGALLPNLLADRDEAAREAYRAERDLPAEDDLENPYAGLEYGESSDAEYAAADARARELAQEREAAWADFEPLRLEAEAAAWAELDAMTPDEVAVAYDAMRERERDEMRAANAQFQDVIGGVADELSDEDKAAAGKAFAFTLFGPRDIFVVLLALGTAFGIGTGLRGD